MHTTARNATLADLADLLTTQQARKLDVVAGAASFRFVDGLLVVTGTEAQLDADGVTTTDGTYRPTAVFDEGLADKLGIPLGYVRRMRTERPDLYDANANGWLAGSWDGEGPDPRSFMLRLFRGDTPGSEGIARAMLSDRYRIVDHLDVLTAALQGIKESGTTVAVQGCDLTERRMTVRITAPEVQALAPDLLAGYRSPFSGESGSDNPVVFAGLQLSNSETGGGAFTVVPRLVVQVCSNGMTVTTDAVRAVHVGGKLDEGVVRWSDDTQQKNLDLVAAKARDAVTTFLDVDYMRAVIRNLTAQAGARLTDPAKGVEQVGKRLGFTAEQTAGVLGHFIEGGQVTAGGVMQAVTSYAQTLADPDAAYDLEAQGIAALEVAAAVAGAQAGLRA